METGGTRPYKLLVREDVVGRMTDSDLAGLFAHELGRRIGLANTECPGTIMQKADEQSGGSIKMRQATVGAQDVRMSRVNYNPNLRPTCSALDPRDNYLDSAGDASGSCMDGDGDGVTTCAGDCNDDDPAHTYNCGGGGCTPTSAEGGIVGYCDIDVPPSCSDGIDNDCDRQTGAQDEGCICPSPALIDTRGDGFDLTDGAGGVQFDINMDGLKDSLSWTSAGSDDAWLAPDRNGDGQINDGGELFGNYTPRPGPPAGRQKNGFLALAEFDRPGGGGNGDRLIDGRDSVFSSLRLWQDADHDGLSQPEELHAPESLRVASFSLDYQEVRRRDRHGNEFRYQAPVSGADERTTRRLAYDVSLVTGRQSGAARRAYA